jgi:predicted alpha/beta superfamily hydrolase
VDIHHITSRYLRTSRRLTIYRPRGHASDALAAVLYLNDGQNLFDAARAFAGATWRVAETIERLVTAGVIPPLLVVGIDHGGIARAREYLPVVDARYPHASRPLGRHYVEFVTREVVPFIERTYRVPSRTSARVFGGSYYGAVAALFTVLERPGVFGRLLLESPSLHVGGGYLLGRARRASRWPSRVHLGIGTAETSRADINQEAVANVRALAHVLGRAGLGPRRLNVVVQDGATHSEGAWASRLPHALAFLFGVNLRPTSNCQRERCE